MLKWFSIIVLIGVVVLLFFSPLARNLGAGLGLPRPTESVVLESENGEAFGQDPMPHGVEARAEERRELEIVTILGYDSIPAILEPNFVSAEEAARDYSPEEGVLGVSINGEHRAYSIPTLSRHEIVNDVLGGMPIAVTW